MKNKVLNEIYELAQEFKENKLWNKLLDSEYFAIEFPDKQIGFVRIIGFNNDQKALNLYLGEEALDKIKYLYQDDYFNSFINFENHILKQDMLQMSLDNKDLTFDEIIKSYSEYLDSNNLKHQSLFPNLIRYKPYYFPEMIQDKQELNYLRLALIAQNEIYKVLKQENKNLLGFKSVYSGEKTEIPLLRFQEDESIEFDLIQTTEFKEDKYPLIKIKNENNQLLNKVKALPKRGVSTAILFYLPYFLPYKNKLKTPLFLCVTSFFGFFNYDIDSITSDDLAPLTFMMESDDTTLNNELINLAQFYLKEGFRPESIRVMDKRTYSLLEDFCQKTDIKLIDATKNPSLINKYYHDLRFNVIEEFFENLDDQLVQPGQTIKLKDKEEKNQEQLQNYFKIINSDLSEEEKAIEILKLLISFPGPIGF